MSKLRKKAKSSSKAKSKKRKPLVLKTKKAKVLKKKKKITAKPKSVKKKKIVAKKIKKASTVKLTQKMAATPKPKITPPISNKIKTPQPQTTSFEKTFTPILIPAEDAQKMLHNHQPFDFRNKQQRAFITHGRQNTFHQVRSNFGTHRGHLNQPGGRMKGR